MWLLYRTALAILSAAKDTEYWYFLSMGSRTRRTDFQPWVSGYGFWHAKGFYFGLHFFFTKGPSSAAISQNHHLYLVLLLLLLPGQVDWKVMPSFARVPHAMLTSLQGSIWNFQELQHTEAKSYSVPLKVLGSHESSLSRGGLPGMWSHVLSHLQATSLFQLEKKMWIHEIHP